MKVDDPLLFSTESYAPLGDAVARVGGFTRGRVERRTFPDGERYQRVVDAVGGRDVALVGGTISDADTLELYDLASALVAEGAHTLSLAIPYFGYSTMERAVEPGEAVVGKSRARLLSGIPPATSGTRVLLLDLHSEGIPHYFEGGVHTVHVRAHRLIADAARRIGGDDFVLGCTDAGRAKWVQQLANDLGGPASFVIKRRLDAEHTEVVAVSAHVEKRRVVVYDDMVRSGSSLVEAARAYREAGADTISAIVTHGVLPGDARDRIRSSGLFERLVCTDSHPRAAALADDFLEVVSVAELLAEEIA